jgi:outer membrane protein, multidrug efflux system
MKLNPSTLGCLAVLFVTSCQMAPQQQSIDLPIPDAYPVQTGNIAENKAVDLPWRQFFADSKLQQVIELSLNNNKNLQIAALNVQRVRALYQIEDSGLYPSLSFTASSSQYSATVGITSYELDFWGKVRNQSEQALQQLFSSEEAQRSSHISLIAEVANAWLSYAADKQLLELANNTLLSQQESLSLTEQSFNLGGASGLTLQQLKSTVASAKIDVARYQRILQRDKNALDLLVGSSVSTELLPDQPINLLLSLPELPSGLPSDLLQQRPDIKAAEHELLAANANIGIAKAAFFPNISLTTNVGFASAELGDLFSGGQGTWNFMPSINLPIFNMGRTQANLEVAESNQKIALATYQLTIQQAFKEVSDSLADKQGYALQLQAQQELTQSNQQSFYLSQQRYKQGVDSYLQVLDAQRNLYAAQQQLISAQQALLTSQISLYKTLGGGWQNSSSAAE